MLGRLKAVEKTFIFVPGQDRFSLLSRSFYKDAAGAFVVSDISRPETLDAVVRWKEELDAKVSMYS